MDPKDFLRRGSKYSLKVMGPIPNNKGVLRFSVRGHTGDVHISMACEVPLPKILLVNPAQALAPETVEAIERTCSRVLAALDVIEATAPKSDIPVVTTG
jgi:hypothetical protein